MPGHKELRGTEHVSLKLALKWRQGIKALDKEAISGSVPSLRFRSHISRLKNLAVPLKIASHLIVLMHESTVGMQR